MPKIYLILADAVLILHVGIVLFNIVGLLLIWIGFFCGWKFVRNFWFRVSHLLCMGYVAAQALLGADCPLTVWENALRAKGGSPVHYEKTFIGHWLGQFLFWEAQPWVFTVAYALFFGLIVLSWFWVKPLGPRRGKAISA